jgi:hypothetical protein
MPEAASEVQEYREEDGILLYQELVVVPDLESLRTWLLYQCHDVPMAGHGGMAKTLELLSREFHWKGMREWVAEYVATCDACQRAKPRHHAPWGKLTPLPAPTEPWADVTVDHITSLPLSNRFNELMVVVDRFTKMAHFIPSHSEDDAVATTRRYLNGVVKHHGLPKTIVSDQGTKFTSAWWREMLRMMDTVPNYSTAFHPESDGQTLGVRVRGLGG